MLNRNYFNPFFDLLMKNSLIYKFFLKKGLINFKIKIKIEKMSVSSIDAPFESPSLNYKKMMNSTSKSKALTNEDILIGRYLEKIQQPE